MSEILLGVFIAVIVAVIVVITSGVKIVQPYEQAIYMRLGKFVRVLNQGLNFVCPLINQVVKLDLRTEVLDVPKQEVITKDNSPVEVDAVIYINGTDRKRWNGTRSSHQRRRSTSASGTSSMRTRTSGV